MTAPRECGSCSLCCKVLNIPQLQKPRGVWCAHCKPGKGGCSIFGSPERPEICSGYACAWRQAPDREIPDEFRPDRVHAVIDQARDGDATTLRVVVEPHYADTWRRGSFGSFLRGCARRGLRVVVVCNGTVIVVLKPATQEQGIRLS